MRLFDVEQQSGGAGEVERRVAEAIESYLSVEAVQSLVEAGPIEEGVDLHSSTLSTQDDESEGEEIPGLIPKTFGVEASGAPSEIPVDARGVIREARLSAESALEPGRLETLGKKESLFSYLRVFLHAEEELIGSVVLADGESLNLDAMALGADQDLVTALIRMQELVPPESEVALVRVPEFHLSALLAIGDRCFLLFAPPDRAKDSLMSAGELRGEIRRLTIRADEQFAEQRALDLEEG